jgi:hypothetical protein
MYKIKVTYSELTSHWSTIYTNCTIAVTQMRNLPNQKVQHLVVPKRASGYWDIPIKNGAELGKNGENIEPYH